MIVATTENLSGYVIVETLGEVTGLVVRTRGLLGNFSASLRQIFGGSVPEYENMVTRVREDAINKMKEQARSKGANAILAMRFVGSELGTDMSEIVAYGTAVIVSKKTTRNENPQ